MNIIVIITKSETPALRRDFDYDTKTTISKAHHEAISDHLGV